MSNGKPSEHAWEIATWRKLKDKLNHYEFEDDARSGYIDDHFDVTIEEALAAQAELDSDEVTDAEIKAAIAAVQELPIYVAEERFADRQWREIKSMLQAAKKARHA